MSLAFTFAVFCGLFVAVVFALVVLTIIFGLKEEIRFNRAEGKKQKPLNSGETATTE